MVTQQQCAQAYRQVSRVTIGATKLCAGEGTRDTCNGDSGGGLFSRWTRFLNRDFEINTTLNFRNLGGGFAVVGVTSFGVECARDDFPGVYTRYKKNLFSPRIKTTLFCSGSMSICRGFNKTWARHEANFWNQTFILKILVCLPQYIFMLSSGQNLNSLHNHYAYHSLVKRKYWQTLTGNRNISSFALTNIRRTLSTQECGPSGLAGGGWCAWHCKRLRSAKYAPTYWTCWPTLYDFSWHIMAINGLDLHWYCYTV